MSCAAAAAASLRREISQVCRVLLYRFILFIFFFFVKREAKQKYKFKLQLKLGIK